MRLTTKAYLLYHLLQWRLTWNRRNTHYRFTVPGNPKFMGPRDAVKLIKDGSVVAVSGLGGNQWANIMYWSIKELYQETGHPKDLTVVAIGGMGGRGIAPGSVDELALPGLATRLFAGHVETYKGFLRLADQGHLELQCIPQGVMAYLIEAQGRGEDSILTHTGIGTFVDPRVGRGTPVTDSQARQWVEVEDDQLRFRLPPIDVAVFNLPACDREGNLYAKNAAMVAESREIAIATRKNGGLVIANVGIVADKGYDDVFLKADGIDAVVQYPNTDQVGSVRHRKHWPMFTTQSDLPLKEGIARLKFANHILGITPRRSEVDNALARLAATVFAENAPKGSLVNIGVGLPEEVCRLIVQAGLFDSIKLFTESGVYGGLPAPGVFFGAAVCPEKLMSSAEIFHMCYNRLEVSILGVLQADSDGNVNVSNRGPGAINYVGPGGFMDFSTAAHTVIFVSSWMVRAQMRIEDGMLRILKPGKHKFLAKVDEVTFNSRRASKPGKRVFYVTNVGVFRLTERGMELIKVVPGIDVQRDIVGACPMTVVLPETGTVEQVDTPVMTGEGFSLRLRE